jgi:hypothetical protein
MKHLPAEKKPLTLKNQSGGAEENHFAARMADLAT